MLVFGRFTLLAWVYVTYMLASGGFYTSTCTRAYHYCGHPLRISLDRVPSTIYACCILHNKALDFKEVHASRSQLKPDVAKKASTWDLITEEFKKTTSLGIPTGKLKTKWKNLISGLKDKNNHSKGTGGGAAKKLNALDLAVQRILGEKNPTLSRMPGAIFTKGSKAFTPLTLPSNELQDDFKPSPEDIVDLKSPSPLSSSTPKRAFTYDPSSYPDPPFKRSKQVVEPKEPSVVEQLHLAQLELIKLQLQIATYTIATQKKPETTEKAVQCDSSLDI